MKKCIFIFLTFSVMIIGFAACENSTKDTTPPVIDSASFLPADCDIYYAGDTIWVHFICSDDKELGSFNIEIHSNFDHHTHGTSSTTCEEDEHHDEEEDNHDEEHNHDAEEGAWIFNEDYTMARGMMRVTVDHLIPIPEDAAEGDYHFMVRLTDRAGWQTIKAVAIHIESKDNSTL
ncbi:MAG: DUF4625 domain-containing protein [Paludibacteraceae bacterium]|nr:DUF4625 domain-containing protein [Paludibacteraceae bacterium]